MYGTLSVAMLEFPLQKYPRIKRHLSDLTKAEHTGGIAHVSVIDRCAIHVYDIALTKDHLAARNTVANLIVDGGAYALRVALIA